MDVGPIGNLWGHPYPCVGDTSVRVSLKPWTWDLFLAFVVHLFPLNIRCHIGVT